MKTIKRLLRNQLQRMGYEVYNTRLPSVYSEDLLSTYHNHSFINDLRFQTAYERAKQANDGADHKMRWRAHVAFWASGNAFKLPGAVVECGVSTGFLMSGIMQMHDWNALDKDCYLFDTFSGIDPKYASESERGTDRMSWYGDLNEQRTRQNFAEFQRVHFVVGPVPDTLGEVDVPEVCYLSLDMNNTVPEIAAFRHFWPRMVPGGWVVLDDYAYSGYAEQYAAFNKLGDEMGFSIVGLPTGQGLIQKPPRMP